MNPFRSAKSRIQTKEITKSLGQFVRSSTDLCGAVFVLLEGRSEALNTVLPLTLKAATAHNARYIGMTSGLQQFVIQDAAQDDIEEKTMALSQEIAKSAGPHAPVVWTVQRCTHGCWGDDSSVSYGALVPNFREIMTVLASAKPGEVVKV